MYEPWIRDTYDWVAFAACRRKVAEAYPEDRQHVANLWFPVQSDCDGGDAVEAMAVCHNECPVRQECLAANLNEKHGVFGGTTPKQRERIRSNRLRNELRARRWAGVA